MAVSSPTAVPASQCASPETRHLVDDMLAGSWRRERDVVALLGAGLEEVAEELLRRGQKRILAYLPTSTSRYAPGVLVTRSVTELEIAVIAWGNGLPEHVTFTRQPTSEVSEAHAQEVAAIVEMSVAKSRVSSNTIAAFGDTFVAQAVANLPTIAAWPTIAALKDAFRGQPMLVVAPGPSLARNLDLVAQAKDKMLVCALSHSLAALGQAGVIPDLVLTSDPQDLHTHFDGFPVERVKAFVSAATVNPNVFAQPVQRHFTFAANLEFDEWVYENPAPVSMRGPGTVAANALSLGKLCGCDPIVFVGLDLSFPAGQYYIDSVVGGDFEVVLADGGVTLEVYGRGANESQPLLQERTIRLPGYAGGTVPTSFMFSLFHHWFEEVAQASGDDLRILNCTEGGAYIAGMEHVPFSEALARYAHDDLAVAQTLDAAMERDDVAAQACRLSVRVDQLLDDLKRCVTLAHRCAKFAIRAHRRPRDAAKLKRLHPQLMSALNNLPLILALRHREIGEAADRLEQSKSTQAQMKAAKQLYGTVATAAKWLSTCLAPSAAVLRGEPEPQERHVA